MGGCHRPAGRAARGVLVLFLVLVLLAAGAGGVYLWATGASGPSEPVTVEIHRGATAAEVGDLLEERGVIRSALAFRVAATLQDLGSSLRAGTYELTTNMRLAEALAVLEAGPEIREVTLTIPEGLEIEGIASEAAGALDIQAGQFQRAATSGDYALPPYLPEGTPTVEGFLFPETYGFADGADADRVIIRLLSQFEEEAARLPWTRARRLGLTPYEVVIVASMVEREARVPADRRKIAAVIYNRLERDMRLQIDATVQYALPEENRILTEEDYRYPSAYNTYLHHGLPPTPIGSPGLASLRAALQPAEADYLYFVVTGDSGKHAFAETYRDFLRLKERAGL